MRKFWIALGGVALLGSFLAGFWPQWQKRRAAERACASDQASLLAARHDLQLAQLNGLLFDAVAAAQARNLGIAEGQAQLLSSGIDALTPTADPAIRPLIDRARTRATEMREAARRLDTGAVDDLNRAASDLRAVLREIEKTQRDTAQAALPETTR